MYNPGCMSAMSGAVRISSREKGNGTKAGRRWAPYDRGLVSRAILSRPRQCEISSTSDMRTTLGISMHDAYVQDIRKKKIWRKMQILVEGVETLFLR